MKLYFAVIDLSKPNDSLDHAWYGSTTYMNDLAGHIEDFARKNGTDLHKIRFYVYDKKTVWDRHRSEHASRCVSNYQI